MKSWCQCVHINSGPATIEKPYIRTLSELFFVCYGINKHLEASVSGHWSLKIFKAMGLGGTTLEMR